MATWTATLWLDDLQVEDHEAVGQGRMVWQFRDYGPNPRLQAFLAAMLTQVQSLEDVTFEVLVGIWPLTAIGAQLDVLGKIVGQPRGELTDDEYRIMILGRIFVNKADGQMPQFLELLEIIGLLTDVQVYEEVPAAFVVSIVSSDYPLVEFDLIGGMKPAGVAMTFVYSRYASDDTFQASGTYATEEYDSATGAGSVYDAATGGRSAGCFRS